jgi:hypothetical protein
VLAYGAEMGRYAQYLGSSDGSAVGNKSDPLRESANLQCGGGRTGHLDKIYGEGKYKEN